MNELRFVMNDHDDDYDDCYSSDSWATAVCYVSPDLRETATLQVQSAILFGTPEFIRRWAMMEMG